MDCIKLPVFSYTASAYSYQWVPSLQAKLCIPRETRVCHRCKRLAEAQREHFNCSLCHAEIIRDALKSEKVACNKQCSVTGAMCYFTGYLTATTTHIFL